MGLQHDLLERGARAVLDLRAADRGGDRGRPGQAQVEQIHTKVRERDQTKGLDLDNPMVARCPKCSAQTSGGKFCPECGATLRPRDACGQCGAKMAPAAKFCPECGAKRAG